MITLKLYITNISDNAFIKNKCVNYSYAFRRMYKMIDESSDANFINRFKETFNLNDIEFRSLLNDVKSYKDRNLKQKEKTIQKINEINKEIDTVANKHKKFKLLNRLSYLKKSINQDIVFGGRKLLKDITNECNKSLRDDIKLKTLRSEFSKKRVLPLFIIGEANSKGNRFFNFHNLAKGICIYKPQHGIKIDIEFKFNKRQEIILNQLSELSNNKEIPISVRLSNNFLYLIYDEEKVNGYGIDEVSRRKEVSDIKKNNLPKEFESKTIKDCYKKYYSEQENKKLEGKIKNRCISIDLNPTNIGYSILQKVKEDDYKIIHVGCFDYDKLSSKLNLSTYDNNQLKQNNKRKYELTIIIKELFRIANHYKCSSFIMEELNLENDDLGNKVSNRKVKNIWNRELLENIIKRRCKEQGISLIEVNPCYSSFIGNIQHPYGDSASASVEIGRRGLFQYITGMFFPQVNEKDLNTLDVIFDYHRDDLSDTDINWKRIYKTLRETLDNQSFQHRFRSMNIHSNEYSFSMNSYKSKVNSLTYKKYNNLCI